MTEQSKTPRTDAERYRWLRENTTYQARLIGEAPGPESVTGQKYRRWYHDSTHIALDTLDAAIDAARKEQKP